MESVRMVKGELDEVKYERFVGKVLKDLRRYKEDATRKDAEDIAIFYKDNYSNWKESDNHGR